MAIGLALIERIRRTGPGQQEIRRLAYYLTRLPRPAWPALLPALRGLAADPERAGEAGEALAMFAAGTRADADYLLALFRQAWPPLTMARTLNPQPDQQRAGVQSRDRVHAYLDALCAVADKSPAIRPALLAAARTPPTSARASGAEVAELWETLAAMGVDIDRLLAGLRPGEADPLRAAVRNRRTGTRCPPAPGPGR